MLGVTGIFGLVVLVDVVCGPLLTLVLASPSKSRSTLRWDLTLVAVVQLAALGYGMWSVFAARPVAVVFEVDRFVVVTANEVLVDQLDQAPTGLQSLPWAGVRYMAVRSAKTAEEQLQSVELSMNGVTTAVRPGWWLPFADVAQALGEAAKPLADLIDKRPEQREWIEHAVARTGLQGKDLRYLPLTSSRTMDWVVLLDEADKIVGHVPVDGFD